MEYGSDDDGDATARQLLKKAYVLTGYGHFDRAIAVCEKASRRKGGEILAPTIRAAILTASGRPKKAMRILFRLHRQNREAILVSLYLAEACFLAGRQRRGWKVLDSIDAEALADSPWREFENQLRQTWQAQDKLDDWPQPLTVSMGDDLPGAEDKE